MASIGETHSRRTGKRCFANATLASEEDDPRELFGKLHHVLCRIRCWGFDYCCCLICLRKTASMGIAQSAPAIGATR